MNRKQLSKKLTTIKKVKGITDYSLYKDGDLQKNTVIDIQKGDKNFTIDSFLKFCDKVGIEIELK